MNEKYDAVVVGGGLYGCSVAALLKERLDNVLLVEREPDLLCRASYANQARVHRGYHYPRSFNTAYRSNVNFPHFLSDFRECVSDRFVNLYCIARNSSKTSSRQFERFCRSIGARIQPARNSFKRLFSPKLIESVYEVEEFVFDANLARQSLKRRLIQRGVEVRLNTAVIGLQPFQNTHMLVALDNDTRLATRHVFNCTYSAINHIGGLRYSGRFVLKHEIAEIALLEMSGELKGLGVTVMDGPFFSTLPFPAKCLHSLTHVRYTPHAAWIEDHGSALRPRLVLDQYPKESKVNYMLKDAQRYLPPIAGARYVDSLFEIKTVLLSNEIDDGRPILFEKASGANVHSILGGKIDNVYDVLALLQHEFLRN
jgi:glycine/D-amino acid oxidase-like deaminating enzyme